ncbi:MAG: transposase family protein [Anaeroplasmataceae bacterium]|nr:transposase family protein [Anaeroplasmataceae bacterium]
MNDYTLKLFKLTHLNINIDKSFETITNEDETILNIYLNLSTPVCPNCNSNHIKIVSSVTSKLNYSIFVNHKTILKLHRRKFQCKDCCKYFLEKNPIALWWLAIL